MSSRLPDTLSSQEGTRIVKRVSGYYWIDSSTGLEGGPFRTRREAQADLEYSEESDYEPGDTLEEAEDQLGLSNWIDPDTGELSEASYTHIEDH